MAHREGILEQHPLETIRGTMPAEGTQPTEILLRLWLGKIAGIWAEQGVTDVRIRNSAAEPDAPMVSARLDGKPAYICMPRFLTRIFSLPPVTPQEMQYCERVAPDAPVFYACLTCEPMEGVQDTLKEWTTTAEGFPGVAPDTVLPWKLKVAVPAWQVSVSGCHWLREGGAWLPEFFSQQFLPYALRTAWSWKCPFLGPLSHVKLAALLPGILKEGKPVYPAVEGLYDAQAMSQCARRGMVSVEGLECLYIMTSPGGGADAWDFDDFGFLPQGGVETTLLLREDAEPGFDILELEAHGRQLSAACPHAAMLPEVFKAGLRLQGRLDFCAGHYTVDNAAFKLMPDIPPPPTGEAASGRRFLDCDGCGGAELVGVVQDVGRFSQGPVELWWLSVLCDEEDDRFAVNVYVHAAALAAEPRVGDFVHCAGRLSFIPLRTEEAAAPKAAMSAEEQSRYWENERALYGELAPYSLAQAVMAVCVSRWGWKVLETPCVHYYGSIYSLLAQRPDGVKVAIYVDSTVNGRKSLLVHPGWDLDRHKEYYGPRLGEGVQFLYAMVKMAHQVGYRGFAFSGWVDKPLSVPPLDFPPFREFPVPTSYRPPRSGEDPSVHLFEVLEAYKASCVSGEWKGFAQWLRDDVTYRDTGTQLRLYSKEDAMRWLTSLELQHRSDCEIGYVETQDGGYAPCCARRVAGALVGGMSISLSLGLVVSIVMRSAEDMAGFRPLK